jgi:DNA invertase Pin-like site-specific DNA recombinase
VESIDSRGVKLGRKPVLTLQQIAHARNLIDKGKARQYVADLLSVVRSMLYRALNS